jgi:predicted Zn-dependent peptidase
MVVAAYRTPSMKTRDARVLDFISTILSDGKSSDYMKIVDDKRWPCKLVISNNQEDYGMYILYGLPQAPSTSENLLTEIDAEIVKLQTELISDKELQKLQNKYENQYVNSNASIEGVASNLATYYMLYNDVNLINTEIEMYRTITPDIRTVAKKYLNPNQRLVLDYVPSSDKKK